MPVMEKKVLSLLGLSAKSGNLVSGEFSTEKAVKEHKAALVVVAEDASDNTKKSFSNMCAYLSRADDCFRRQGDTGACHRKAVPGIGSGDTGRLRQSDTEAYGK